MQPIVDMAKRYEVSLRSTTVDQTVSVTPRNTSLFRPDIGQVCTWTATHNNDSQLLGSGNITVDADALVTAQAVPVVAGQGSRLIIACP